MTREQLAMVDWKPGLRVKRGPDWRWSMQGGWAATGMITRGEAIAGWVGVDWANGDRFAYRCGDDDKYDLVPAGPPCPICRQVYWLREKVKGTGDEVDFCGHCGTGLLVAP